MPTLDLREAEFISSRDLAAYLGCSRMTISRMRRAGRLPKAAYADGAITLWASDDIAIWEQAGRPLDAEMAKHETDGYHKLVEDSFAEDRAAGADAHNLDDDPSLPLDIRLLKAQMRHAVDVCDRLLNSCRGYLKADAVNQLDRRQAIINVLSSDSGQAGDTTEATKE